VDPVVGTDGVRRGRGQRGSSGRHVDSSGAREERGGEVTTWEGGERAGDGDGDGTSTGGGERRGPEGTPRAALQPNSLGAPLDKPFCTQTPGGQSAPRGNLPAAGWTWLAFIVSLGQLRSTFCHDGKVLDLCSPIRQPLTASG